MRGAIYHFTDKSEKRPVVFQKQLRELEQFAEKIGVDVEKVYCDFSLKKKDRTQFNLLLMDGYQYSALVTKDFYHISKNTAACMKLLRQFRASGIVVYTLENGVFDFSEVPYNEPLRVASYTHADGKIRDVDSAIQIQQDIFSLFVKRKTNWTMVEQYSDVCHVQNDAEQEDLMRLVSSRNDFDILIVSNLCDIHWRTARFCKIREMIGKPIFSLQDGYLMYKKEEQV